jgi:hypothetical protein
MLAMDRNDLMNVIRMTTKTLPQQDCLKRLPQMSHVQLQQLACLVQYSCRLETGLAQVAR